jgi:hypothetical protein
VCGSPGPVSRPSRRGDTRWGALGVPGGGRAAAACCPEGGHGMRAARGALPSTRRLCAQGPPAGQGDCQNVARHPVLVKKRRSAPCYRPETLASLGEEPIKFASADCRPCAQRSQCTRAQRYPRRTLTVRPREQYEALKAARERQSTSAFKAEQARRAGIEGTLSYGIRACGLRRSRYIGLARTHVQHVLTAAAMNLARVARWLADEPRARTRRSPLLRLQQAV